MEAKNGSQEDITEKAENHVAEERDETDVFGSSFYKDHKKKPEAVMPVPKNAIFYKMNHKYRGTAVILNHENFMPNMKLKPRAGTNVDKENLENTLKKLGFNVQSHYDKRVEEIVKIIEQASLQDHSDNDCFLLACLSHGEQGILYANDAPYKPETLWNRFTADKCPSLAGKPKLFFIQACQGDKLDGGVTLRYTQVDSSPSYKIPTHADFLVAYSTIPDQLHPWVIPKDDDPPSKQVRHDYCVGQPHEENIYSLDDEGFYSWRNTARGSWFMQALCEELNEKGFKEDLLTLLTSVNRKVAIDYESNVPDNSVMHAQKQIPCITFMLTRILKFEEKNNYNEV